jgi:hypothetical protein
MKSVAQNWTEFARAVLHPDAHPSQHQEMRRAFYAGAWAMLCEFVALGGPTVSEDSAIAYMDMVRKECEAFKRNVSRGNA